ncbi:MAG: sulfatase-like hydrolase/transferase [Planctomycetes bacterium]|nr:sulfatase-like hydrolase/transferase [Planctomycetota bacterium]
MNFVGICLDTFRADVIGKDKKLSFVETPNLDAFAKEGVTFDRAFGEGQPTLQIRRAFYTGCRSFPWRYNFDRRGHWHHAAGWHKIPPHQDTLAEILLARGYNTGLVADVYHMFKPAMNYWRGFVNYEFIRGQESDNWKPGSPKLIEEQIKRHVKEPINWRKHSTLVQYLLNNKDRKSEEDYLVARVMRTAADRLEGMKDTKPFFLWVEAFDPHEPWDPPTEYADKYCPDYTGRDYIMPGAAWENEPATEEEIERIKALYYGEVTFVDKWVGHLLKKIDDLGLRDDTLVMVLSDHGTQVYDDGGFGKGGNNLRAYNTGIVWHVRHPDGPTGHHVPGFVQSHDVMPTILNLLDVPCDVDGQNVWPLVTGEIDGIRDHVVIGWAGWANGPAVGHASVRDDEWNYAVAVGQEDKSPKLYRIADDPEEKENVIDAHPDVVAKQRKRIEAVLNQPIPSQQIEVCDPAPSPIAEYMKHKAPE